MVTDLRRADSWESRPYPAAAVGKKFKQHCVYDGSGWVGRPRRTVTLWPRICGVQTAGNRNDTQPLPSETHEGSPVFLARCKDEMIVDSETAKVNVLMATNNEPTKEPKTQLTTETRVYFPRTVPSRYT